VPPGVFWEEIVERSIKGSKNSSSGGSNQHTVVGPGASKSEVESTPEPEEVMMVEVTWMQPYLPYMINKTIPKDVVEERRIVR
jgi:hypothetical protein